MRVFVTGATGFVGSAVSAELIRSGHDVIGLARNEAAVAKLQAAGVTPYRGSLSDPASLAQAARQADAVMHLAFIHDFSNFAASVTADNAAIAALGEALTDTGKTLIVTSGIGLIAPGKIVDENEPPTILGHGRASETSAMAFAGRGVKVGFVRLPPSVHGDNEHGFVPTLIDIARRQGVSAYVESGDNRWSTVHVTDAAKVYRGILETGADQACYHAVAEQGLPFRALAEVIGEKLGMSTTSIPRDQAADHFGWIAHFAQLDMAASSDRTRATLNWTPTGPTLVEDLRNGTYFAPGQFGLS